MEKINKKTIKKLTELQDAVMWLQNEAINNKIKSPIFYLEHLGPIYRVLTSLKKDLK